MSTGSRVLVVLAAAFAALGAPARADIVCPDQSSAQAVFTQTFNGDYRNGQPRDLATISLGAGSETFASNGITIHVYLKNCSGVPLAGVPPQEIVLFNSGLCICPGGNIADAATDINGHTTFTGALLAGGCVNLLSVYADGILIANLPVKTNSPDVLPASPCFIDASDIAVLAAGRGGTDICLDWNEDGHVDASDLAYFANVRGGMCP